MARMFHVALALEFARFGRRVEQRTLFPTELESEPSAGRALLIDEVENGIHYTVHAEFWKFVFRLASLHGIQVFATSHSWDCVQGFQIAATEASECEGMLIRIEKKDTSTNAVTFTEKELQIVSRDEIEVR